MRRAEADGDPVRRLRSITRKVSNDDNRSPSRTGGGKIPTKYKSSSQLQDHFHSTTSGTPSGSYATPSKRAPYPSLSRAQPTHPFPGPSRDSADPGSSDSQLESLEALLARAGYKETRVFTPEAEKVKAFARRVVGNFDDEFRGSGSGLRHVSSSTGMMRDPGDGEGCEESPLRRWGNAPIHHHHSGRSEYHYIEPSLPADDNALSPDQHTSSQGASSSLRSILATDAHRSRIPSPIEGYPTQQQSTTRQTDVFDAFDQIIHARIERIARSGSGTAQTTESRGGTDESDAGRKRRVLNRVELDFAGPLPVATMTAEQVGAEREVQSFASSLASVTISDPSFGNDMPSPPFLHHHQTVTGAGEDGFLRTVSIDEIDEEEFEEVARVDYQLSRHVFPPRSVVRGDVGQGFDTVGYEAEGDGEGVVYADQEGYAYPDDGPQRGSSDGYGSQGDSSRSDISETDYGVIQTASIARRPGTPNDATEQGHHPVFVPVRVVPVKRTIIPGSPPHLSTALDTRIQHPTTITTRVGDRPVQDRREICLSDGMTARKLRHAISTPAFGKQPSSGPVPPLPGLAFRAPSGQAEGWLSKVGRVWSGSSVVGHTSKASVDDDIPKRPRVPGALRIKAPARPASPRIHRTGPVVCNTQDGEDLPPVSAGLGKMLPPVKDAPKRGLRTMFSLQNLRSAVVPLAPTQAINEETEEDPLTPTLSPRLNWDARDLWDPQPLGGFNTLYQKSAEDQEQPRTIYPEPDFTKSFFYSPATPPAGISKSAKQSNTKQTPLQPKRQQSIKSLRAALEKDTARLKVEVDIPPVPALPKHLATLATPQKSNPTPPMIAINSPNSCEAGLPPRALSLEGEDWEGGSFESRKAREARVKKGSIKRRRSGLRHSKTAV